MRWPWQQDTEHERALRAAETEYARLQEAVARNVQQQMAEEDRGWTAMAGYADSLDLTLRDLDDIRKRCRALWRVDPTVRQAERLLASGTFGEGISTPAATDDAVQAIIDEHWDDADNQLALYSHEAMVRSNLLMLTDGEQFLTLHTSRADHHVKLGEIDPSEIVAVVVDDANPLRPVAYARRYYPSVYDPQTQTYRRSEQVRVVHIVDWTVRIPQGASGAIDPDVVRRALALPDVVPDMSIYHLRPVGLGRRGIPEIYPAYDWIKAQSKTLSALVTWTRAQAAIAWQIRQTVTTQAAANRAAQQAGQVGGVAGIRLANDQSEMTPVDVGTGQAANLSATVRQVMLQGVRAFGFGEHFYGDASSGKYTTAANMEMPVIWNIQQRQTMYRESLREIVQYALWWAQDRRKLPSGADLYFDLEFPPAEPRTPQTLATDLQALGSGVMTGLLDPREAAYHAYLSLGSNDIDEILERQFGAPGAEPDELPAQQQPDEEEPEPDDEQEGEVAEAAGVRATPAARSRERVEAEFQRDLQAKVLDPWHASLGPWLERMGEAIPEPGVLATRVAAMRPDERALQGVLDTYLLRAANLGGALAVAKLRRQVSEARTREAAALPQFVLDDPALLAALKKRGEKITGEVVQSMLDALGEVLSREFYDEGKGPAALADSINEIFPPTYANRAETIARTETCIAQMTTLHETYVRSGVEFEEWLAFIDEKTRESHAAANGQVVPIGEPFRVGDAMLMHPGDPDGPPEEIINCRCDVAPVVASDSGIEIWTGGGTVE